MLILLTESERACSHMLEILTRKWTTGLTVTAWPRTKSDQMHQFVVKNLMYFAICPDNVQLLS